MNVHVGIESIPVCTGQKEGKPQLTGCQSIAANYCYCGPLDHEQKNVTMLRNPDAV